MEQKSNKFYEVLKKHGVTILVSLSVIIWTYAKDMFSLGAEVKFKQEITKIVKEDLKTHFDTLIDNRFEYNLKRSLDNPMIWYDALSSDYVKEYAEKKAIEIRKEVEEKLLAIDSIQTGFVETIGKSLGIRDEDVMPLFKKMMRDYVKRQGIDKVTAAF